MARQGRVVFPGIPHHVTQRGNRRERIFFEPGDEQVYLDTLSTQLARFRVACWSYCLMPNHVHLILVPEDETGLARAVGEAHRRYTTFIGVRSGWMGHLFQGRFGSVAMDEDHLMAAFRYVAMNPVKARLATRPEDWEWSSTRAHIGGQDTPYVSVAPALSRVGNFAAYLTDVPETDSRWMDILKAEFIGRPVGAKAWIENLEAASGRTLSPQKRGPKPKVETATINDNPMLF